MHNDARDFVEGWIEENVHPTGYDHAGNLKEAKMLALACRAAADEVGIGRAAVDAEFASLVNYITEAIEAANVAEVARLGSRND